MLHLNPIASAWVLSDEVENTPLQRFFLVVFILSSFSFLFSLYYSGIVWIDKLHNCVEGMYVYVNVCIYLILDLPECIAISHFAISFEMTQHSWEFTLLVQRLLLLLCCFDSFMLIVSLTNTSRALFAISPYSSNDDNNE